MVRFIIYKLPKAQRNLHYLHSNMVRFIILDNDLKIDYFSYLHSNMVRFIIFNFFDFLKIYFLFTFQYG